MQSELKEIAMDEKKEIVYLYLIRDKTSKNNISRNITNIKEIKNTNVEIEQHHIKNKIILTTFHPEVETTKTHNEEDIIKKLYE